jgi:hypothetical protein
MYDFTKKDAPLWHMLIPRTRRLGGVSSRHLPNAADIDGKLKWNRAKQLLLHFPAQSVMSQQFGFHNATLYF